MKKYIKILILFMAVIGMALEVFADGVYLERQRHGQKKEKAKQQACDMPLKVASFSTNPPFGWVNVQESKDLMAPIYTAHGYGIDLMKKIGEEVGVFIKPVGYKSDKDAWNDFQAGRLDVLIGQYYDPKLRKMRHSFISPAYFPNVISVIFMKGKEKEVKTFNDLMGMKGIVRQDEKFYPYIRPMIPTGLEIEDVTDSREAFTKLLKGEADYLLGSPYSAEAEARRFKLHHDIRMIKTPLLGQELFILYSANAPCKFLRARIAQKLSERRKDLPQVKRDLISYIDEWGLYFKDKPSLKQELHMESDDPVEVAPIAPVEQTILDEHQAANAPAVANMPNGAATVDTQGAVPVSATPSVQNEAGLK